MASRDYDHTTDFGFLSSGKSLGKKIDVLINTDDSNNLINPPDVNLLELKGKDEAAMNLQIAIAPPLIIPVDGTILTLARAQDLVNSQNASGSSSFSEMEIGGLNIRATPMIAYIDWGIGGAAVRRVEVDIMNGSNLNLSASFLRIGVGVDPLLALLDVNAGDQAIYELAAFVGPGHARPNNAQRTIHLPAMGTPGSGVFGTSPVVPIPLFATRCTVAVAPGEPFVDPNAILGWVTQIVFFSGPNAGFAANPNPVSWQNVVGVYTIADNGNGERSIEIPNGAYYVAIRHANAFDIQPSLIFDLGI